MKLPKFFSRAAKSLKENNERGARRAILEDLFYDFNRSRVQVYKINFVRGIMIGAGAVIGGTVVIGLLVWLLSLLGSIIPPLGEFFDALGQTLENSKS